MSSHRSRGHSPPRYYGDPPRATTGAVYVTSYDTSSRGGGSSSSQPRTSVSGSSSGRHSSIAYEAQPLSKSKLGDGKTKTEYAVRARHGSYAPPEPKRPLSISTRETSPPIRSPVLMASPREATPTSTRDDSSRFLMPASTQHHHGSHQRHNSTSMSDMAPRDALRARRERSYNPRPPYVEKVYHDNRQPARGSDDEGWSYTGPREQFHRDYPQRAPNQRDATSRRERPMTYYPADRPPIKQEPSTAASASRHLVKHDRREPDYHGSRSGFDSDPDRGSDAPKKRHSLRPPVLHQQSIRDDGYSSARDDYDSRTRAKQRADDEGEPIARRVHRRDHDIRGDRLDDRSYPKDSGRERSSTTGRSDYNRDYERDARASDERRKPRSREHSPEHHGLKEFATGALGTIAAAGVAKTVGRDHKDKDDPEDDDDRDRKHRRRRHKSRKDDQYEESDPEIDRRHRSRRDDQYDEPDPDSERRRRSRREEQYEEPEPDNERRHRSRKEDRYEESEPEKERAYKSRKDDQYDESEPDKDRRHRSRKEDQNEEPEPEPDSARRRRSRRDSRSEKSEVDNEQDRQARPRSRAEGSSSSESPGGHHSTRSGSHRRRKDDKQASDRNLAPSEGQDPRASKVRAREQDEASEGERTSREMVLARKPEDDEASLQTRTMSPGENEDDRPRRVQLVEPVKGEENLRPRGILKPARQVPFPEDPNPIREGVAPLKDATKDGIPPDARWTKINRLLVNPEALEKAHERFEERDDYVIVLRVLSREEIKKLADKTKEIRDTREREWQAELKDRRSRKSERGGQPENTDSEIDYDRDEDQQKSQLAIEAPSAPPADFHNLQNNNSSRNNVQDQQQQQQQQQQTPQRAANPAQQVPDINVESNYSQNV